TLEQMRQWAEAAGRDWGAFGIDQRISVADGEPDEWRAMAEEWRDLGATHLTLVTTGGDFQTPDDHLARLREGRLALAGLSLLAPVRTRARERARHRLARLRVDLACRRQTDRRLELLGRRLRPRAETSVRRQGRLRGRRRLQPLVELLLPGHDVLAAV